MCDMPEVSRPEVKRGRLRRLSIDHHYDEDGNPAGHTVIASHQPETSGGKSAGKMMDYMPSPPDVKTVHETGESAMAKVNEYHQENAKRFGGKKGGAKKMDDGPMRAALGRKR